MIDLDEIAKLPDGSLTQEEVKELVAQIRTALEVRPETLPQPIGSIRRRWWRLGWLSAQAVARDMLKQ